MPSHTEKEGGGKEGFGSGSDWKGNLERYITDILWNKRYKHRLLSHNDFSAVCAVTTWTAVISIGIYLYLIFEQSWPMILPFFRELEWSLRLEHIKGHSTLCIPYYYTIKSYREQLFILFSKTVTITAKICKLTHK